MLRVIARWPGRFAQVTFFVVTAILLPAVTQRYPWSTNFVKTKPMVLRNGKHTTDALVIDSQGLDRLSCHARAEPDKAKRPWKAKPSVRQRFAT